MKKLVIHCASGIKNTGDEAILDVLLSDFHNRCDITVISLDAAYSERMHPGIRFLNNTDPGWRKAVKECDLFILGGGGLIQDTTTCFNVGRWLSKLRYAMKCGKKTMVYANSLEPFRYGWNRRMAAKCLKKTDAVTLRDPISWEIAQELGVRQSILTADPVYCYETVRKGKSDVTDPCAVSDVRLPKEYIVMTVRHWYDMHPFIPVKICSKLGIRSRKNKRNYESFVKKIAEITEYFADRKNIPVVWLSCCYERDAKVAKDVIARLENKNNHIIINEPYMSPDEMMQIIGGAKLLIGMRLHSFIYAFLQKTPVLMLAYQEKVRGMAQMAGVTEDCFDIDSFSPEVVIRRAEALMDEPQRQLQKTRLFSEKMEEIQKENVSQAWKLLGEKNE